MDCRNMAELPGCELQDAENIMLEKSVKAIRGTAITLCLSR
jgi:hypothetical protein